MGEIRYPNKDRYVGPFSKGVKHGDGEFTYANYDVYKGKFENDHKNDKNCTI